MKWLDMPPFWLLGALVLAYLGRDIGPLPRLPMLGGLLILLGLGLIAAAAVEFRRHRTTIVPRQTPSALIRTGIFAKTRNPIYLGDALILAGAALYWTSLLGLLLVPVFIWVITKRFIEPEEAGLRDMFVAEFDDYAQETNRWL